MALTEAYWVGSIINANVNSNKIPNAASVNEREVFGFALLLILNINCCSYILLFSSD